MTSTVYICLGRAGDILNLLPLLKRDSESGVKPIVVTTSPFHEIFEGASYVEVKIFPSGNPQDITGAVEFAKQFGVPRVVQVAGPEAEIKKHSFERATTDSWAKEAWRLAGQYEQWKHYAPTVFDQRSVQREEALMPDKVITRQPTIVLATGGVSSPFKYRKLLTKLVELRFRKPWFIMDLSKVKAHRLYDLLGILERAKFLIATDSAVLHLARAVPTLPVVALQADSPGLWNGSPWRPEYIWTCRHRDFPTRAPSMLEAINDAYHNGLAYLPTAKREGRSIIHLFSAYEGINSEAKKNWQKVYDADASWIHTPAYFGVFGRDSKLGGVGDDSRFAFVKDVIRMGMGRAKSPTDTLLLTKSDTCFWNPKEPLPELPFFSHRTTQSTDGKPIHHPAVDVFCFTREWWQKHVSEFPDMILARDYHWQRCLAELIRKHGGREVPFLSYQAKEDK